MYLQRPGLKGTCSHSCDRPEHRGHTREGERGWRSGQQEAASTAMKGTADERLATTPPRPGNYRAETSSIFSNVRATAR